MVALKAAEQFANWAAIAREALIDADRGAAVYVTAINSIFSPGIPSGA